MKTTLTTLLFNDTNAHTFFSITRHPIKISDIRVVLPIKLGALDTAQIERFKSEISSTKAAIVERRYQLEKASLALSMTRRELEKRMAKLRLAKDGYEYKKHTCRSCSHSSLLICWQSNDDALTLRSKPGRTLQHSRTDYLLTEVRLECRVWGRGMCN